MTEPQRKPLFAARLAFAAAVSFTASVVACGAAATEPGAHAADVHPLTSNGPDTAGSPLAEGDSGAPGDGGRPDGGCPYGALEDPHRGFVRCLAQGEKSPFPDTAGANPDGGNSDGGNSDGGNPDGGNSDGGNSDGGNSDGGSPSGSGAPAPSAAPTAAPSATPTAAPSAPPPGPPPIVEIKAPKFENGDVPKAEKNLSGKKVLDAIAQCVADAGGLTGKTASLKVEFLVRSRGKAEGVEVTPTGVSEAAARCVRTFLKNRSVGVPTADPTGVTVVYTLKPSGK